MKNLFFMLFFGRAKDYTYIWAIVFLFHTENLESDIDESP